MGIAPDLNALLDQLRGLVVPDEMTGDEAVEALQCAVKLKHVAEHLAAMLTGVLNRCGVAAAQGRTPRELLISLGCAPSVAERLIRVGGALPALPTLAAHAGDGAISGEHVDAIVKGINHIRARAPGEVDEEARFAQVTDLLGQFFSGATPAAIADRARKLGNRHAAAEGGLPAAEDRAINTADHRITSDGRVQVRADLDRWERDGEVTFVGRDGPREFAVTAVEAQQALQVFLRDRLPHFGPHEDAMLSGDRFMAHSLLSAPMNLGLLDPLDCAYAAEDAYRSKKAPISSVEGYIRQLIGWRDYIWHVYWHFGENYRHRNALHATNSLPAWFTELDADAVQANCLKDVLAQVRDHGWVHHIPRLMVLSNYALQRGWDPAAVTDWFHRSFVDGYDWVMVANVVGMSLHADGGLMATKPYASGGAYINRMSDYCGGCRYQPSKRVGEQACPFTGGYWWFLARNTEELGRNRRMAQPMAGLGRLKDLDEVVAQQRGLGDSAP